jgi:hypothetical protein
MVYGYVQADPVEQSPLSVIIARAVYDELMGILDPNKRFGPFTGSR